MNILLLINILSRFSILGWSLMFQNTEGIFHCPLLLLLLNIMPLFQLPCLWSQWDIPLVTWDFSFFFPLLWSSPTSQQVFEYRFVSIYPLRTPFASVISYLSFQWLLLESSLNFLSNTIFLYSFFSILFSLFFHTSS